MKKINNMSDLEKKAIKVIDGMLVVWPQSNTIESLEIMGMVPTFNGCYAVNNATVCVVNHDEVFVIPYMKEVMEVLQNNGFTEKHFYVPFSNWDYPKFEQKAWEDLRREAEESWRNAFVEDCKKYCASKGIKAISDENMEKCFKMPEKGVEVEHIYFKTTYYPVINSTVLDCVAIDKLGTYNMNNGKVVFVYIDGKTYVTKGYKIIDELREAGYKEGELFVPFSNGEAIVDPFLKKKWDDIKK